MKDKLKIFEANEFTELSDRLPQTYDLTSKKKDKSTSSSASTSKTKKVLPGFTNDTVPPKRITGKLI